jgi:deazaflavin-dependent oxidoreductase (nitroreductase family)
MSQVSYFLFYYQLARKAGMTNGAGCEPPGTGLDTEEGVMLISDNRLRAMYAGGQGNATARWFSRCWARVFDLGILPRRWVTLEVTGRRSGRIRRFPLGMADWEGRWYLVPMLGERCQWVRNVRAADGQAVIRRRRAVRCRLVELPEAERPAILRRYLLKVPGARPHIPVRPDAPEADFAAIAPRYPVFLVVPSRPAVLSRSRPAPQPLPLCQGNVHEMDCGGGYACCGLCP